MDRLWADAEAAYRQEILTSLSPRGDARLLDVGCEDGSWTEAVRERLGIPPGQVYGMEIEPRLAERARARGFDVRTVDVDSPWPFDDSSFDVVHANQVIEHVRRLDHFASELGRVLRRGGIAIVCTENLASWHNVGALVLGFQPFSLTNISGVRSIGNPFAAHADHIAAGESFQHLHVLAFSGLRDLFAAHGFAIERSWGSGYHPLPGALGRLAAKLDPRHAHFIAVVAAIPG